MQRTDLLHRLTAPLLLAALALSAEAATTLRITANDSLCRGELVLRAVDDGGTVHMLRIRGDSVDVQPIDLDPSRTWQLSLAEPAACWAPPLTIALSAATHRVFDLPVWPGAELTGRLNTADRLTARFSLPAGEPLTVPCAIGEGRRFSCRVPSTTLDIRLEAPGFAPFYLWETKPRDIGQVVLTRGASVSGWVLSEAGKLDLRELAVKLVGETYTPNDPDGAALALATQTAKPNARGFFQFTNVPPGSYTVVAEKRGLSSARVAGVAVQEAREHALDTPLAIRPLAEVEVFLAPALAPDGTPWTIELRQRVPFTDYYKTIAREPASQTGEWRRAGVDAGRYELVVSDATGAQFGEQVVSAYPGMPPVTFAVSTVAIRGRVSVADKPVRGTLRFGGRAGESVTFRTDDDGAFAGHLAHEGKWMADIIVRDSEQRIVVRDVEVRRRDGEEAARVDVVLPGGRIAGRVVDEQGNGIVAGLLVTHRGGFPYQGKSDEKGTFELLGVEETSMRIQAMTPEGESDAVEVVPSDEPQPLTLVVAARRKVEGWLTTAAGHPIAGAKVIHRVQAGPTAPVPTAPNGRFRLEVSRATAALDLAIIAPGLPMKLTSVPLSGARPSVHIVVGEVGGRLIVALPRGSSGSWPTLRQGTIEVPLTWLLQPAYSGGAPRNLMAEGLALDLEPGAYTVCSPARRCTSVAVHAGSTVRVDASDTQNAATR